MKKLSPSLCLALSLSRSFSRSCARTLSFSLSLALSLRLDFSTSKTQFLQTAHTSEHVLCAPVVSQSIVDTLSSGVIAKPCSLPPLGFVFTVTVKIIDAPVRVDQVDKGWRGSPLMMKAHNEEENDIILAKMAAKIAAKIDFCRG